MSLPIYQTPNKIAQSRSCNSAQSWSCKRSDRRATILCIAVENLFLPILPTVLSTLPLISPRFSRPPPSTPFPSPPPHPPPSLNPPPPAAPATASSTATDETSPRPRTAAAAWAAYEYHMRAGRVGGRRGAAVYPPLPQWGHAGLAALAAAGGIRAASRRRGTRPPCPHERGGARSGAGPARAAPRRGSSDRADGNAGDAVTAASTPLCPRQRLLLQQLPLPRPPRRWRARAAAVTVTAAAV